jgi:hypothetical protein
MLLAGENSHSDQAGSARYNSKNLHTYAQRDLQGAIVYNNACYASRLGKTLHTRDTLLTAPTSGASLQ